MNIRNTFLFFFLLLSTKALSQTDSIQELETDSLARIFASNNMFPDQNPIVYFGLNNPITIEISNAKPETIQVTSSNSSIRYLGNGKAVVLPQTQGSIRISATWENQNGHLYQKSQEFIIKATPTLALEVQGMNKNLEVNRNFLYNFTPMLTFTIVD